MRRVPVLLLDLLIAAGLLIVVAIALTGGGTAQLGTMHVSFRSVGNGLLALSVLAFARLPIGRDLPFLGWASARPSKLGDHASHLLGHLVNWTRQTPFGRHLAVILIASVAIRMLIAWSHPGFFSGDDVEIHEMTFASLQQIEWPAWHLRSAFYPFVFIYPIQALLTASGVAEPALLVFAGRCIVAIGSPLVILLVYRTARSQGPEVAVLAAMITSLSALLVTFGSTELPRPISAVFVVLSFLMLQRDRASRALAGGGAIGVAAAIRFSEALFFVPALVQLALERRWRDLLLFGASSTAVALTIQAVADYTYWGRPFASASAIVDYTVIGGLSSRGYQPVWHYLVNLTQWTDYVIAALAVYGTSRLTWRYALWAGLPLACLSLFPHKEPRYLIPIVPFVALLAASGLWRMLSSLAAIEPIRRRARAGVLTAALAGSVLFQVNAMHVRRSDGAVRFMRTLREQGELESRPTILAEQPWRFGGRIYAGFRAGIVQTNGDLHDANDLLTAVRQHQPVWVFLGRPVCDVTACRHTLASQAFTAVGDPAFESDAGYVVFRARYSP